MDKANDVVGKYWWICKLTVIYIWFTYQYFPLLSIYSIGAYFYNCVLEQVLESSVVIIFVI